MTTPPCKGTYYHSHVMQENIVAGLKNLAKKFEKRNLSYIIKKIKLFEKISDKTITLIKQTKR